MAQFQIIGKVFFSTTTVGGELGTYIAGHYDQQEEAENEVSRLRKEVTDFELAYGGETVTYFDLEEVTPEVENRQKGAKEVWNLFLSTLARLAEGENVATIEWWLRANQNEINMGEECPDGKLICLFEAGHDIALAADYGWCMIFTLTTPWGEEKRRLSRTSEKDEGWEVVRKEVLNFL